MWLGLSGCRTLSMKPSSNQAGNAINSFLRPDGSVMYFIQNLEWKSQNKKEYLTLDITTHTSSNLCDTSICQLSWFTAKDTIVQTLELSSIITTDAWSGQRMYKRVRRKYVEHRFEFIIPTQELVQWLEIGQGKCIFFKQTWELTRNGMKANIQAQQTVFPEWRAICP